MKTEVIGAIIILLLVILGIMLGYFLGNYNIENSEKYHEIAESGCFDGCELSTRDEDGRLNQDTWDCWEECTIYVRK